MKPSSTTKTSTNPPKTNREKGICFAVKFHPFFGSSFCVRLFPIVTYEILWMILVLEEKAMPCDPEILRQVPLFALLDDEEACVLAGQVEVKNFAPRQRIYKIGDPGGRAYVMVSGSVRITTIDEDNQEVVVDQPSRGEFFGFASMLEETPHQTTAVAQEQTVCLEVDRHDISVLLERKPMAGMDMLTVLGRQFHASQQLVRVRASRNPNQVIEEEETFGERIADTVASFGGSWTFIIFFIVALVAYASINVALRYRAWDPYPFILLNLFLSMLAAIQAPVIMMSQNRQDKKDRLRGELDYEVNRRAEIEIQGLARKMNLLGDKIEDVEDLLRKQQSA
jgi:CRP/FNR family cyclic AMP-dependent transcriptional regulator